MLVRITAITVEPWRKKLELGYLKLPANSNWAPLFSHFYSVNSNLDNLNSPLTQTKFSLPWSKFFSINSDNFPKGFVLVIFKIKWILLSYVMMKWLYLLTNCKLNCVLIYWIVAHITSWRQLMTKQITKWTVMQWSLWDSLVMKPRQSGK